MTLYRRNVTQPSWVESLVGGVSKVEYVPVSVQVSSELAFDRQGAGSGQRASNGHCGSQIHGAQLRAADAPHQSEWWAQTPAQTLEVHRRDTYQCARWAPLLEKAIARFSQTYGQYGGDQGASAGEKSSASGYANIDGGWSHDEMFLFYGGAADLKVPNSGNVQQQATQWAPGSQVLASNPKVVDQLILLQGCGDHADPNHQDAPILTATSMVDLLIKRLSSAITAAQIVPDFAKLTTASHRHITAVQQAVSVFNNTQFDPDAAKTQARAKIGTACLAAVDPKAGHDLFAKTRASRIKELLDLMLDLKNIGTATSPGQRNVYGNHVYSVVGVNFCNTTGVAVPLQTLTPAQRPAFFPLVDTGVSHVRLRNPHHTNEPDPQGKNQPAHPGDGVPSGAAADGMFTMNLEQFFRNTAFVRNETAAPSAMLAIRPGANSSLASVRFVSSMLLDNTGFADLAITGTRTIEIVNSFLYKPQVVGGKPLPLLTYASPQRLVIAHSSVILSRLADLAIENPPAQKPVPVTLRDSGLDLLDEAPGEGKSAALQLEQTQAQVVPKRPAEDALKLVLQEYSHALPGTLAANRLTTAFGLSALTPSGGVSTDRRQSSIECPLSSPTEARFGSSPIAATAHPSNTERQRNCARLCCYVSDYFTTFPAALSFSFTARSW